MVGYMFLKRFIKSPKSVIILVLLCVIAYMSMVMYVGLGEQWKAQEKNDRYEQYFSEIETWKKCVSEIEIRKVTPENTEVILFDDLKRCGVKQ